jgi:hypothetical protein
MYRYIKRCALAVLTNTEMVAAMGTFYVISIPAQVIDKSLSTDNG